MKTGTSPTRPRRNSGPPDPGLPVLHGKLPQECSRQRNAALRRARYRSRSCWPPLSCIPLQCLSPCPIKSCRNSNASVRSGPTTPKSIRIRDGNPSFPSVYKPLVARLLSQFPFASRRSQISNPYGILEQIPSEILRDRIMILEFNHTENQISHVIHHDAFTDSLEISSV
jgi:hypothetical protein